MVGREHHRGRAAHGRPAGPLPGGQPRGQLVQPGKGPGRPQDLPGPPGDRRLRLQVGPGRPAQQLGHLPVEAGQVSHGRPPGLRGRPEQGQGVEQGHGPAGDQQQGVVGGGRPDGVDLAEQVAVAAGQGVGGDDPGADLVADHHRRGRPGRRRGRGRAGPAPDLLVGQVLLPSRFATHRVRQSTTTWAPAGAPARARLQVERLLDRPPARRPPVAVAADPLGHLGVSGLGGDHHRDRAVPAGGQPLGQGRLAAAGAAEQQGQGHQ